MLPIFMAFPFKRMAFEIMAVVVVLRRDLGYTKKDQISQNNWVEEGNTFFFPKTNVHTYNPLQQKQGRRNEIYLGEERTYLWNTGTGRSEQYL